MDDLGLQSTSRLRSTIAAGTPSVNSVGSQADHAVLDAINAAARTIVQAVQENGGEIVIGDDVIYRSFNRARQSQSIMLGVPTDAQTHFPLADRQPFPAGSHRLPPPSSFRTLRAVTAAPTRWASTIVRCCAMAC